MPNSTQFVVFRSSMHCVFSPSPKHHATCAISATTLNCNHCHWLSSIIVKFLNCSMPPPLGGALLMLARRIDWMLSWGELANQAIIPMILCPLLLHSVNRQMNNCFALSDTKLLILFDHSYLMSAVHPTAHVRDCITMNFPLKEIILMSAILCTMYCTKTVFSFFSMSVCAALCLTAVCVCWLL